MDLDIVFLGRVHRAAEMPLYVEQGENIDSAVGAIPYWERIIPQISHLGYCRSSGEGVDVEWEWHGMDIVEEYGVADDIGGRRAVDDEGLHHV